MSQKHYQNISKNFEKNWFFRPDYVEELASELSLALGLKDGQNFCDLGCGTGNYTSKIVSHSKAKDIRITGVDFSQDMVDQFCKNLLYSTGICSDIEAFINTNSELKFDKVLLKEVIHHIKAPKIFFTKLANSMNKGGAGLIATRPQNIDFPFFPAALKKFADGQPSLKQIHGYFEESSTKVLTSHIDMPITLTKDRLFKMIENRFMSIFGPFSESEISRGIDYIDERFKGSSIKFNDRIILVKFIFN